MPVICLVYEHTVTHSLLKHNEKPVSSVSVGELV